MVRQPAYLNAFSPFRLDAAERLLSREGEALFAIACKVGADLRVGPRIGCTTTGTPHAGLPLN